MTLFKELIGTEEGIMSLIVIVFMIGMAFYLGHMFVKKMNDDQ